MDASIKSTSESVFSAFAFASGNQSWSMNALPTASGEGQWILPTAEIAHVIAGTISKVPQVVAICIEFVADSTRVWTLLESYDRAARELVYEKEMQICQQFAFYGLEFKVTSVDLVSAEDLVKDGLTQIYKR